MSYSIKELNEQDWWLYASVRLKALQADPRAFSSSYQRESSFTESDWRSRFAECAIFALFENERPIGVTGVAVDRDDPTKRTALFWGSWIEPESRGKGLSKLFYESRIDWAKKHPSIDRIKVSHRESNVASKFANQKFNFVETSVVEKTWHDGIVENEILYELRI